MSYRLRIPHQLLEIARIDLARPHAHALERVGFLFAKGADAGDATLLLAYEYLAVPDEDYLRSSCAGATIGTAPIRRAIQRAVRGDAVFHVHEHGGRGTPGLSFIDRRSLAELGPSLCAAGRGTAHGAVLLSSDHGGAVGWRSGDPAPFAMEVSVIGYALQQWKGEIW